MGEHCRHGVRAVGLDLHLQPGQFLTLFLQDGDDIEGSTAADAHEQKLHRTAASAGAAEIFWAVELDRMAGA